MWKKHLSSIEKLISFLIVGIILTACYSNLAITPTTIDISSPTPTDALTLTVTNTKTLPACVPFSVTVIVPATPQSLQKTPCVTDQNLGTYDWEVMSCFKKYDCLFANPVFADYPVGVGNFKGYYSKIEKDFFGKKYVCDSFIIVDGSPGLIYSILSLIDKGNNIYSKNDLNQPITSINLSTTSKSDAALIKGSTLKETVKLIVLAQSPVQRGTGDPCFSRFEILKVESASTD